MTGASQGGARAGQPRPADQFPLDDGLPSGDCRRVLGIFAHPDDETFCAGGTFARYAQQGAEVMVVSATRGQAGQIRNAAVANRRTIAAVREAELRLACQCLGITKVRCLDHVDGTLADADFRELVSETTEIIRELRPNVVITFGSDGGYGHPDHVVISAVTTAACRRAARAGPGPGGAGALPLTRPPRLYHRCFPPADMLVMDRLASWLTSRPSRFAGTASFAHSLLLLTEAAGTMRHIRDDAQVRWYPPGALVVEQGEAATELFLILSGEAAVWKESRGGRREQLALLGVGEFFGELGIATQGQRSADVAAATSLTCLVLSPTPPTKFAGRGRGARLAGVRPGTRANAPPAAPGQRAGEGVVSCDVSEQVARKVQALCAYRSQLSLEPDMLPQFLLQEMFGNEYFMAVSPGPARLPGRGAVALALDPEPTVPPGR